jgi:tetratricopeptide (TPR) repeat protein
MKPLIKLAIEYEEQGQYEQCEQVINQALQQFGEDQEVLRYAGVFLFKQGRYAEALDVFVNLYKHAEQNEELQEDLLEHILAAYYWPNEAVYRRTYEQNYAGFLAYRHNHMAEWPLFDDLSTIYVPRSTMEFYAFDKASKRFLKRINLDDSMRQERKESMEEGVLLVDVFQPTTLQFLEGFTQPPGHSGFEKHPIDIMWPDCHKRQAALQTIDYGEIIALGKFAFFSEWGDELNKFRCDLTITGEERKFYTADIAYLADYSDPVAFLSRRIAKLVFPLADEKARQELCQVLFYAYDIFTSQAERGDLIHREKQCADTLTTLFGTHGISLTDQVLELVASLARDFFLSICNGIQRKVTLKWILYKGFQLKLWGRDWERDLEFKPSAMGCLASEEELAKTYHCTKIVLTSCGHDSGKYGIREALLCGALPILRYLPPDSAIVDIKQDLVENEHFVFYHDKQDLLEKLDYYLKHEEERLRMVKKGRKRVLESLTCSETG